MLVVRCDYLNDDDDYLNYEIMSNCTPTLLTRNFVQNTSYYVLLMLV